MAKSRRNKWSHVTFKEIAAYIETHEIAQLTFAKQIGVTNSTFHNWKASKSVPDEEKQLAIAKVIGKAVTQPAAAAGPETLDDLLSASGSRQSGAGKKTKKKTKASKKKTKKKAAKKAKKTKKAKAKKKVVKKTAAAAPASRRKAKKKTAKKAAALNGIVSGNGQGSLTERAYLVGRFMDARGVKTVEEFGALIQTVTTALG